MGGIARISGACLPLSCTFLSSNISHISCLIEIFKLIGAYRRDLKVSVYIVFSGIFFLQQQRFLVVKAVLHFTVILVLQQYIFLTYLHRRMFQSWRTWRQNILRNEGAWLSRWRQLREKGHQYHATNKDILYNYLSCIYGYSIQWH